MILAFTLAVQFPFKKICSQLQYEHKPLLKCGNPTLQLIARKILKKNLKSDNEVVEWVPPQRDRVQVMSFVLKRIKKFGGENDIKTAEVRAPV